MYGLAGGGSNYHRWAQQLIVEHRAETGPKVSGLRERHRRMHVRELSS